MKVCATSRTRSTDTRFWAPGAIRAERYQRSGSAPTRSKTSHGSTMLPTDFDIFFPSLSTMWPRQMQLRKATLSETRVEMAWRV